MWLLTTSNPEEPSLVWVSGPQEKPYAILSHTWEEGQELTFQEMQTGSRWQKNGYQKIIGACAQAAKDGYEYVWIDTVCINKESSAELTEAINSMWQWYCDAGICYALLTDIDSDCPLLKDIEDNWETDTFNDPESSTQWPTSFAAGRWFQRGWTLQELLAPRNMHFFGCAWNKIGTKTSLLNRLRSVTGIDKLALEDRDAIGHFVIARRMCWAAKRETSRVEDRAYCLLGIFGINMPLLYGEGSRAFLRLQEQLVQNSTDHSIFAWEWSDERTIHDDLIFARSPDQFYPQGTRMIFWEGNTTDHQFALTNRGIEFHCIPMLRKQHSREPASLENESWILLNCRYEHSSSGIALRLVQTDDLTTHINPLALRRSEAHWVSSRPNEARVQTWTRRYPVALQCTLLRHHLAVNWNTRTPPKFRIRFAEHLASTFTVKSTWPARLWFHGSGILCLPLQSTYPDRIVASASISLKGNLSVPFVHVALSFYPVEQQNDHKPRLALSRVSQEDARTILYARENEGEANDGFAEATADTRKASRASVSNGNLAASQSADSIAAARLSATELGELCVLAKIKNRQRIPENPKYDVEIFWAESEAGLRAEEVEANMRTPVDMALETRPLALIGPRNRQRLPDILNKKRADEEFNEESDEEESDEEESDGEDSDDSDESRGMSILCCCISFKWWRLTLNSTELR